MYSYNRATIIGYQTQPVEVRQTPNGTSVTDLNIVVPYQFESKEGQQLSGKSFFTVTLWGGMADTAGQFLKPGAQVFLAGRLQTDTWDDQSTGEKRRKTKIVGMDMTLLDPRDGQLPAPDGADKIAQCLNRADVLGNVTRDPELRTTPNGTHVLTLGVATNDRWRDKSTGEDKERAEYHDIVIWGDEAEQVHRSIRKGSRVFATGRIQNRTWETQDGQKRVSTEIVADSVMLLGIENAAAKENVSTEGYVERMAHSDANSNSNSSDGNTSPDAENVSVPEVEYASEVKVEDLPF